MQKFNVMVFERKRDGAGGRVIEHKGRMVPEDSIPTKLPSFVVTAADHDVARRAAREKLNADDRTVVGISFSAESPNTLLVYVFPKG